MSNTDHLNALYVRLSNERDRLAQSTSDGERALRAVWVEQCKNEIRGERAFLGLDADEQLDATTDLSEDEIFAELFDGGEF